MDVKPEKEALLSRRHPKKFEILHQFFDDLCTNYGNGSAFEALGAKEIFDVYIIATR